ncbi:hypothetical protein [Rhizobium leguminosarum]|uniref:hypothetical protein n=1 Tax=Rhizobium leguminosarum TaxID=384 RepID=UPI003518BD39
MKTEDQVLAMPVGMEREARAAEDAVATLSFGEDDDPLKQSAIIHSVTHAFLEYSMRDRKLSADKLTYSSEAAEIAIGAIDIVMDLVASERQDEVIIFDKLVAEGSNDDREVLATLTCWREDLRAATSILEKLRASKHDELDYLQMLRVRPDRNDQPHERDLLWRLFECFCDATGGSRSMGFSPSTKTPFFAFYNFAAAGVSTYKGNNLEKFSDIKTFADKMQNIRKERS